MERRKDKRARAWGPHHWDAVEEFDSDTGVIIKVAEDGHRFFEMLDPQGRLVSVYRLSDETIRAVRGPLWDLPDARGVLRGHLQFQGGGEVTDKPHIIARSPKGSEIARCREAADAM